MFQIKNSFSWFLILSLGFSFTFSTLPFSTVHSIEIYNSKKKAEREAEQQKKQNLSDEKLENLPPVIVKNTAPFTFGYYNKYTEKNFKPKELKALLNSIPENSKYQRNDKIYTGLGSIGIIMMGVGILIPAAYKFKKEPIPKPAFAASMGLLGTGFVTTTVFFSLKELNQNKAVKRYNEYILGVQKKF